jgi:cardiolipin synthase A/B
MSVAKPTGEPAGKVSSRWPTQQRWVTTLLLALTCVACSGPRILPSGTGQSTAPIVTPGGKASEKKVDQLLEQRLESQDDPAVRTLITAFREQAQTPLVTGNRVQLLIDGPPTLQAMREAIRAARHHVHLETYIFGDDAIGRDFRDLLLQRRVEGIQVRVLYDAVGSMDSPGQLFEDMRAGGIEVLAFRPLDAVRTLLPWKMNNRDHRKLLVVDGRVAFTGGINISDTYEDSSSIRPGPEQGLEEAWRDTHVKVDGPVVAQFQALFLATWTRAGGKMETSADYFPAIKPTGAELVAAVALDVERSTTSTIYATYLATIRAAGQRVWLTNAYFAPNRELRLAMIEAAARGVDVRLIVPGFTDSGLILHASRATYDELLEGGVRIYEQRHALLHAKTAVLDGALSMVGSANLDMRSFLHNNEINAVIIGSSFAKQLEQVFQRDLAHAEELTLEQWRKRPLAQRLKEFGSRLFAYWL